MKITTVGIDLARNVFQVHAVDERGAVVLRKQLRRDQMTAFFREPAALCDRHGGVRQRPPLGAYPEEPRPRHSADVAAVRQALRQEQQERRRRRRGDLRSGRATQHAIRPVKSVEQQAVLSLHRVRQGFVKARTAQANQIRSLLGEFGLIMPAGISHIAKRVPRLLEDAGNLLPGRDSTSKSHQGQQLGCTESPDVRVQSIPPNRHQLIAWQTGASMYRHSVLQIPLSANGRPFIDLL